MKHHFPRMTSLALAFGIFFSISCSNLQKTESGEQSDSATLQEQIRNVNRQISEQPQNSELQIQKAKLLYRYSLTIPDPASRRPVYVNIRDIADSWSSPTGSQSGELSDLTVKAWRMEHQSAMKLLQNSPDERSEQAVMEVVAHLENAITVSPDSLKTYSLLATTHYQHGNVAKAIETLEKAGSRNSNSLSEYKEKLAYLYLETGDLPRAEKYYRELATEQPDNLVYTHGLINVLILSKKHEEAIELLENLSEEYSTRYTYQESLATEMYYLFREKTSRFIEANNQITDKDYQELAGLLGSIHSIFETIHESLPKTEENIFRMAAFYKNASLRLQELPGSGSENITSLQSEFMEHSLPLWERLAELNPDNLAYMSNLHQVYVKLDMTDEAEAIERSYNF